MSCARITNLSFSLATVTPKALAVLRRRFEKKMGASSQEQAAFLPQPEADTYPALNPSVDLPF
jgi:hypothetical protein